ncbi:MAG: hypothetical protein BGO38_00765 [Cellulomonas sp. 73-145]|uniref:hypothetical protein n=1 Tax=Cellulomonas sp. 73-145 TaxID=1895739 RepID=UPI000927CE99|nr:hypothetical protein [Cellulomonas sp. 73-145]MBN9328525.1 hypothetical protein [Cellulomonas sp.]OJV60117.1 MAG: hypothetical protein BGO38_00765 [Cellulomonas sp. 73-145]
MGDGRGAPRGGGWSDVVMRVVIGLAAGGFTSWSLYRSVLTWVPLAFLAAFLAVDGWRLTDRARSARRRRNA